MENKETSLERISESGVNFFDGEQFETIQRVAKMFVHSDLVPDIYRVTQNNKIDKAMANTMLALDMSQRIGANALMIMQNLHIIKGKPSWSSKFLISTVNTCGRFAPLKFRFTELGELGEIEYTEYNWVGGKSQATKKKFNGKGMMNVECVAYTTERGGKDVLESPPVTMEMAIKEGWYQKNGSKWKTMPKLMLTYRAATFWVSVYAPELSMGMKTEEELRDIEDVQFEELPEEKAQAEIEENANAEPLDIPEEPKTESKDEPKTEEPNPFQEAEKLAEESKKKAESKKEEEPQMNFGD